MGSKEFLGSKKREVNRKEKMYHNLDRNEYKVNMIITFENKKISAS